MPPVKVIDRYPLPSSPGKRPVCCALLSPYVAESNQGRMDIIEGKKKDYTREYLERKMRRRIKQKIPADQCSSYARYYIDGNPYCRKHGAYALLDLMAERE